MAVVNPTFTRVSENVIQFSYVLARLDTGTPIHKQHADYSDRSAHWSGIFGVNGSVTIEGSASGTEYHALTNTKGDVLTKIGAGVEQIMEGFPLMRPHCTDGDGTTAVIVDFICRRPRSAR